jgi:hypothetical protein
VTERTQLERTSGAILLLGALAAAFRNGDIEDTDENLHWLVGFIRELTDDPVAAQQRVDDSHLDGADTRYQPVRCEHGVDRSRVYCPPCGPS